MSTNIALEELKANSKTGHARTEPRKVRAIRKDSFHVADRGSEWAYTFHATWWHQVRGVRGFHDRLVFGISPKTQYPAPPNVDEIAALCNEETRHTWQVSE